MSAHGRNLQGGIAALASRIRREGVRDAAQRVVNRMYQGLAVAELEFPLRPGDIADSRRLSLPVPGSAPGRDRPARIGWLSTPPSPGSGGHTTLFRMVQEVEAQGHECVLFLYDRHGGQIERHASVIREHWPKLRSRIVDAASGVDDVDACVASGWQTAHVLAARTAHSALRRLYFIQDYEPYFYPRGSLYALAEDSYQFGFRHIALGSMVERLLRSEAGVDSEMVEFGCDTSVYSLTNRGSRSGVVMYEKPGNDRRGFLLARLALERFHREHPEHPIHVYGGTGSQWSIPVIRHGRLDPAQLNALYNQHIAGIAMSFTNISLVAEEMLAAGMIPVVNDSDLAKADLAHPEAVWASPTPAGIADALARTVGSPEISERAGRAAQGVRQGWQTSARRVASIILDDVWGTDSSPARGGSR
jgi:hypothetical protein